MLLIGISNSLTNMRADHNENLLDDLVSEVRHLREGLHKSVREVKDLFAELVDC